MRFWQMVWWMVEERLLSAFGARSLTCICGFPSFAVGSYRATDSID
jgi:hypothetical protein